MILQDTWEQVRFDGYHHKLIVGSDYLHRYKFMDMWMSNLCVP